MRLEKWFISNLDDSQRKIIVQSIDEDIIVQGAAGSGKTNLAIHRALQAKNKGSYAIVIFTVALKRMIAYGMQALGLDKERIAYEWAWTHRGFDLTGYEVVDIVFKSTKSSCPFDVEFSVLFTSRNRIILFKVLNYSTLISLEKSPNH